MCVRTVGGGARVAGCLPLQNFAIWPWGLLLLFLHIRAFLLGCPPYGGGGGRGISGLAPSPLRKFLRAPMICNITCSSYITITPMIIIASINLFTCVSKLISLSLSLSF